MTQALEKILVEETQTVAEYLSSRMLRASMISVLRDGRKLGLNEEIREGENIVLLPMIAGG